MQSQMYMPMRYSVNLVTCRTLSCRTRGALQARRRGHLSLAGVERAVVHGIDDLFIMLQMLPMVPRFSSDVITHHADEHVLTHVKQGGEGGQECGCGAVS